MNASATMVLPEAWCRKHLGPAEQRVVELAATGLSNKEIARTLGKATLTVRNQLVRAMRKLGVRSRYELISKLSKNAAAASPPAEPADSFAYAI